MNHPIRILSLLLQMLLAAAMTVVSCSKAEAFLTLELTEKTVPEAGSTFSINVNASSDWDISAADPVDWCTATKLAKDKVYFNVAKNESLNRRSVIYRIACVGAAATIDITQTAPEILLLDQQKISIDGRGGTFELKASTNLALKIRSSAKWLTYSSTDTEDGVIISLSAEPNYSSKKRTAKLTVSGGRIACTATVTQATYKSSDYSEDRKVKVWHRTETGRGGNFVVIGDGFSDRMVADGTYDDVMRKTVDAIFTQEPYASLRNLLNVYSVIAVSEDEGIGNGGKTALGCYFYGDRMAYGDEKKSIEYALEAVDEAVLDETVVVVVMNSTKYGGIADWFPPTTANDYGDGLCVAFFAMYTDNQTFVDLVQHEACGHGFAKLADEYDYYYPGENNVADYNQISREYNEMASIGWYKNVDYRSDPALVKWSRFIRDERYRAQKIGVYEGAGYYVKGAYRPTENSLMRTLGVDYNAPSREAIYYRVNKLYYGDDWEYDYEAFVQQDLKNSSSRAAPMTWPGTAVERRFETVPPRNMGVTWREFLGR